VIDGEAIVNHWKMVQFGSHLFAADLDHDGFADLIIGSPHAELPNQEYQVRFMETLMPCRLAL
jgi:hypothetical protein